MVGGTVPGRLVVGGELFEFDALDRVFSVLKGLLLVRELDSPVKVQDDFFVNISIQLSTTQFSVLYLLRGGLNVGNLTSFVDLAILCQT